MDATRIKKIKHSKLYVTDVYLRDITNMILFNFALECELCEHLLFLRLDDISWTTQSFNCTYFMVSYKCVHLVHSVLSHYEKNQPCYQGSHATNYVPLLVPTGCHFSSSSQISLSCFFWYFLCVFLLLLFCFLLLLLFCLFLMPEQWHMASKSTFVLPTPACPLAVQ